MRGSIPLVRSYRYVIHDGLPISPSSTTSIPASAWRLTTSETASVRARSYAAWS